ncbi:hypothetical protein OJAV_G00187610 [Oryzias javanicus]|uniref:Uncharacterized protein n=1 Tax=Oryzias javanicus TaxID=123683 RepID=A0A3S2LR45_ORYJA|nr:hypothetical protein OJAV_G00187610 [Oryzias javanicus]
MGILVPDLGGDGAARARGCESAVLREERRERRESGAAMELRVGTSTASGGRSGAAPSGTSISGQTSPQEKRSPSNWNV